MGSRELVTLGDRYAARGLLHAAIGAYERAASLDSKLRAEVAHRLIAIGLELDASSLAADAAAMLESCDKGPMAKIAIAEANLIGKEYAAATRLSQAAIESGALPDIWHARARYIHAVVAAQSGDHAGQGSMALDGIDGYLRFAAAAKDPTSVDKTYEIFESLVAMAVSAGRIQDTQQTLQAYQGTRQAFLQALVSSRAGARPRQIIDELSKCTESPAAVLRRCELQLRSGRSGKTQQDVAQTLAQLIEDYADVEGLDRIVANAHLLRAEALVNDASMIDEAKSAYQEALRLRPSNVGAASRLAILTLSSGDIQSAANAVEHSLRIGSQTDMAWRSAVRVASAAKDNASEELQRFLNAAHPGVAPGLAKLLPLLISASSDVARSNLLVSLHARGHRVKNRLGVIGSRLRRFAKAFHGSDESTARLGELEIEVMSLYEEWGTYLRSMESTSDVPQSFAVGPLVSEVVAALQSEDVTILVDCEADLPKITGYRFLLGEALSNIIGNAVEACRDVSEPAVNVRVCKVVGNGTPHVEILIQDNGPGISDDVVQHIFSPGFTTKSSGSGIGLSVAERVVTSHDGSLTVRNSDSGGAMFRITLPTDAAGDFTSLRALLLTGGDL